MKSACAYAIVQFRPYVETGEFANVGLVLLCADKGFFGFRLAKRHARITHFFEELDRRVYLNAMAAFKDELQRIAAMVTANTGQHDSDMAQQLFMNLTRPREGMLRFSAPRLVLANAPAAQLDALFAHYVARDFATKEYQERLLESAVRKLLLHANVGAAFQAAKIGTEDFEVNFPFVRKENHRACQVIKPLFLAQPDSTRVLTHGGQWVDKIRRLRRRGALPQQVLFPVLAPIQGTKSFHAFEEIRDDLQDQGVLVIPAAEDARILEFVGMPP